MFQKMAEFRSLFGSLPHKSTSPEYYRWKSVENPFGEGILHLIEREGRVAGSASVTFKRVAVRGEAHPATEIGDTYTHPDFRRQGIFSSAVTECTRHALDHGARFVYGTPNDAALPGYRDKLGYPPVPGVRIELMSKYVSVDALARRLRKRFKIGLISRLAAWVYLRLKSRSYAGEAPASVDVRAIDAFSDADPLWGSDRRDYSFFTVRDLDYLRWRFEENPDTYQVFVAERDDRTVGYVVAKIFERDGEKVGAICDFVTDADDMGIFFGLLSRAEALLREEDVAYAELWCANASPYSAALREAGYQTRTSFPLIICQDSPLGPPLLEGGGRWHFTLADSDNI